MKIYTIANITQECYGQGDYQKEQRICRLRDGWAFKSFPPAFLKKEDADLYLKENCKEFYGGVIVEMELIE